MCINAQTNTTRTVSHDGVERSFNVYLPSSYDENSEMPVVLNFHGYGSNAVEQMFYGDFRPVADTAGFIIVHPQGLPHDGFNHWNVAGVWHQGSTVDDVGFVDKMLDDLLDTYSIDESKVYSTGMSNGGYMSFHLACFLSHRIAAVASVTGQMTPFTFDQCDPQHAMPIMQIHGTDDNTVPYEGALWTKSATEIVEYWSTYNETQSTINFDLANSNSTDNSTAHVTQNVDGINGVEVTHIRIDGGGHTWPGSAIVVPGTNLDFNASERIWQFFNQYDIDGKILTSSTDIIADISKITVQPNPATDNIVIKRLKSDFIEINIYNTNGVLVLTKEIEGTEADIDITSLPKGNFYMLIDDSKIQFVKMR